MPIRSPVVIPAYWPVVSLPLCREKELPPLLEESLSLSSMLPLAEVPDEWLEYSSRLNFAPAFPGFGTLEAVVRDIDAFPGVEDDAVVEPSVKFTVRLLPGTLIIRGFWYPVSVLRKDELSPLEKVEAP